MAKNPGAARNLDGGAAVSGGHSSPTGGSAGTPSNRTDPSLSAAATLASEGAFVCLNELEIHDDDDGPPLTAVSDKKKKRGAQSAGADKSGNIRGLRQFSTKVCEKVQSKGTTTYNEVADELVNEFLPQINSSASPDQQQYDEKNIRRRVYDALNVLTAMDIISKDKKEIQWKGLPRTSKTDMEELKKKCLAMKDRIDNKTAYLQELEEQLTDLQNLIQRNMQLHSFENAPTGGMTLPFIIVQARPEATVEVEISEDNELVHFDFKSTPFQLHDESYVLKAMRSCEGGDQANDGVGYEPASTGGESQSAAASVYQPLDPSMPDPSDGMMLPSSPIPGILRGPASRET